MPRASSSSRVHGDCWVLTSFDVGVSIDLEGALPLLADVTVPGPFRHRRSGPVGKSLRTTVDAPRLSVGGLESGPRATVTLNELGSATVAWRLPFDATAAEAARIAGELHENGAIERAARELVTDLVRRLGTSIQRPAVSQIFEDYFVFHVTAAAWSEDEFARILRAEPGALSEQERASALEAPISYGPNEACYVDWLGAILIGADMEDELRVLELANVTLLELRVLDLELTAGLESSYGAFATRRFGFGPLSANRREIERVSRTQADSALLQENVRNAHKLFGDDYLARLYARAARRFRIDDWDTSTTRKLGLLASVVQRHADAVAQRRSEALEWIIIVLIALDLVVVLA